MSRKTKPNKGKGNYKNRSYQKKSDECESRKESESGKEVDTKEVSENATNDPAWYSMSPQLLMDAASLPFAYPLGGNTRLQADNHYAISRDAQPDRPVEIRDVTDVLPGLATLYTRGTLGCSVRSSDPVNMAAVAMYTQVRYVNSGRKNYDAPDLMMYCLGATDLYAFTFWCKRLYAAAFMYSQSNLYIGRALLEANGVDPNDLKQNLANFRMWLNTFIHRVTSYAIPATMPLFAQRVFMYSGLYIESDVNIKDQLYQFAPTAFYKFKLDEANKGMLETTFLSGNSVKPVPSISLSTKKIMDFGEELLSSFWGDEDFTIMSGDVYKAFEGRILGMEDQAPEALLVPVKDDMVLAQMRNATIVGQYINHLRTPNETWESVKEITASINGMGEETYKVGSIYQSVDGRILSVEVMPDEMQYGTEHDSISAWNNSVWAAHYPKYLNLRDDTSPGTVMEATRLMVSSDPRNVVEIGKATGTGQGSMDHTNRSRLEVLECGVFIVQYASVTMLNYDNNRLGEVIDDIWNGNYITMMGNEYGAEAISWIDKLARVGQFHNFPTLYKVDLDTVSDPNEVKSVRVITNVDNFSIVTVSMLQRMNSVALLSLLYAAGIAHVVDARAANN